MSKISLQRIAGMNLHYKYFPMETFLRDMKRLDISAIEIWGGAPHFHLDYNIPHDVAAYGRQLREQGFQVVCMTPEQCVYPVNIAVQDREIRRRSMEFFGNYLNATAEIGAPLMLITAGWGYWDQPKDDAWAYAQENLTILAQQAQKLGVKLGLEVLRPDESNLVYDLKSMKKMLNSIDVPSIGAVVDTNPMSVTKNTLTEYLEAFGEKLYHVHFVDCDPLGHYAWGDGNRDPRAWLDELEQGGYEGYLTLELTYGAYYMDPFAAVEKSIKTLRSVIK